MEPEDSDLEQARHNVLVDNTAQAVFKHLRKLEDQRDRFRLRWIWELLQNARDAAPQGGTVTVKLEVMPQRLVFAHNGAPFSSEEIAHLVYHGSTKHDMSDNIGQFGSGFLSTHLISKRVRVRGQLRTKQRFDFELNREGASPQELTRMMDDSWRQFEQSLREVVDHDGLATEYTYAVEAGARALVGEGIAALQQHAPYVLAFNHALEKIHINDNGCLSSIAKRGSQELGDNAILIPIEFQSEESSGQSIYVALIAEDDVAVAVRLTRSVQGFCVDIDDSTPRIFVAFPLFGTEEFCFPAVVHSERFFPTEERDGVPLGIGESEANASNKEFIQRACDLLVRLVKLAVDKEWGKSHKIVFLPTSPNLHWLDAEWFRGIVASKIISPIRGSAVMLNAENRALLPRDSWIPSTPGVSPDVLWELMAALRQARKKLPRKEDAPEWATILESWRPFLGEEAAGLPEKFTLQRLAQQVSGFTDLTALDAELAEGEDPIIWLNGFHTLIAQAEELPLLNQHHLLPDQKGLFRKRVDLCLDDGIDDALKDIADALGCGIRSKLLHRGIVHEGIRQELPTKSEAVVLAEAIDLLREQPDDNWVDENLRRANVSLFWWIVQHGRLEKLDGFPALTEETRVTEHSVLTLKPHGAEDDNTPLAPPACWPDGAREFSELFPSRYVLSAEYAQSCPNEQLWQDIADKGYVRMSPLYVTEKAISSFLPDEPLTRDEENHDSVDAVEVSAIAFLARTDVGILDLARGSRTRGVALLRFLLSFVLQEDQQAFCVASTRCSCGEEHRYYGGGWLIPLRNRSWVNLGRNKASKPTAESLAQLIEQGGGDFPDLLRQEKAAALMRALDVSMADLSLRSLAKDETERLELVGSLARMVGAVHNDAAKIHALAEEIADHPEVLDIVQERRARREQVQRNQKVGAIVEQELKESLQAGGFRVTRTGIGSDFVVELVDDPDIATRLEVEKEGSSFLLEVKAVTEFPARMTETQARTAILEEKRFLLCVVRLATREPARAEVVEGVRFVADISDRLRSLWDGYSNLESAKRQTPTRDGDIELEITEAAVRFRVGEETWSSGLTFDEAVRFFQENAPEPCNG